MKIIIIFIYILCAIGDLKGRICSGDNITRWCIDDSIKNLPGLLWELSNEFVKVALANYFKAWVNCVVFAESFVVRSWKFSFHSRKLLLMYSIFWDNY